MSQTFSTIAQNASEAAYPHLWQGLDGAWSPSLGVTGGTLRDVSGRGNHGTLTNMDPATDWQSSGGWCLDFDGSNDDVVTSQSLPASSSRSVAAWVLCRQLKVQYIFGTNFGYYYSGLFLGVDSSKLTVTQYGSAIKDAANFPLNSWQHIALRHVGNSYGLFRNGRQVASGAMSTTPVSAVAYLGSYGGGGFWNGQCSDIAFFSRALTDAEILQLYQLGPGNWLARKRQRVYSITAAPVVYGQRLPRHRTILGGGLR